MTINVTQFFLVSVIDTCSVWNLLSSAKLYSASLAAKCSYGVTKYVEYECLYKPRKSTDTRDVELKQILLSEMKKSRFQAHQISISDLQEIEILRQRKKLGSGELSSIVFARKTNLAFITDDNAARKFASYILGNERVQTTPHLAGYLFYHRHLIDADLKVILSEHNSLLSSQWGRLDRFFNEAYEESLRVRLLAGS